MAAVKTGMKEGEMRWVGGYFLRLPSFFWALVVVPKLVKGKGRRSLRYSLSFWISGGCSSDFGVFWPLILPNFLYKIFAQTKWEYEIIILQAIWLKTKPHFLTTKLVSRFVLWVWGGELWRPVVYWCTWELNQGFERWEANSDGRFDGSAPLYEKGRGVATCQHGRCCQGREG